MRAAGIPAIVLVLLGALSGCGGSSPHAASSPSPGHRTIVVPTPEPPPPGVHLSFIQQRFDEGTNRAQVRVINGDLHPVHVRSVGVDWAGYPLRLNRVDYDVPGQLTVDLRYFLPRASCAPSAGAAPIRAVAVLRTRHGTRTLRQPMAADGKRYLTRLWRSECNARRIRQAAQLGYGRRWSVEGTGKHAVLHGFVRLVRRHGSEEVTVDQVQGSVLFDLELAGDATMASDQRTAEVPLEVRYGRCDEHARSQSTTSFTFRLWLRLGDGEPLAEVVEPTRRQQKRLLDFLDLACGSITSH